MQPLYIFCRQIKSNHRSALLQQLLVMGFLHICAEYGSRKENTASCTIAPYFCCGTSTDTGMFFPRAADTAVKSPQKHCDHARDRLTSGMLPSSVVLLKLVWPKLHAPGVRRATFASLSFGYLGAMVIRLFRCLISRMVQVILWRYLNAPSMFLIMSPFD